MAAANIMRGDVATVDWDQVDALQYDGALVLDVRTPDEAQAGVIEGALHISVDDLRQRWGELETELTPGRKVVVYCATGLRSYIACRILKSRGYDNVYNLSGGWRTYRTATAERSRLTVAPA
jgi:rhodanese-related sulfurtransferase